MSRQRCFESEKFVLWIKSSSQRYRRFLKITDGCRKNLRIPKIEESASDSKKHVFVVFISRRDEISPATLLRILLSVSPGIPLGVPPGTLEGSSGTRRVSSETSSRSFSGHCYTSFSITYRSTSSRNSFKSCSRYSFRRSSGNSSRSSSWEFL